MRDFHEAWAWVVVAANGLVGAWALVAHWRPRWRVRQLWWFTAFAQLAIFAQVIFGTVMVSGQGRQVGGMHMFYGYVAIATVGIVYSYRQQLREHVYALYGAGGLFLMGLAIRAMVLD